MRVTVENVQSAEGGEYVASANQNALFPLRCSSSVYVEDAGNKPPAPGFPGSDGKYMWKNYSNDSTYTRRRDLKE